MLGVMERNQHFSPGVYRGTAGSDGGGDLCAKHNRKNDMEQNAELNLLRGSCVGCS